MAQPFQSAAVYCDPPQSIETLVYCCYTGLNRQALPFGPSECLL